jgi:hypothetical protein
VRQLLLVFRALLSLSALIAAIKIKGKTEHGS